MTADVVISTEQNQDTVALLKELDMSWSEVANVSTVLRARIAIGRIRDVVPMSITENGVAKVRASDVLRTPEAKRQLTAVESFRAEVRALHRLTKARTCC